MMRNRVYIETWGCQMNLHQSEGLAGVMERAGYRLVDRLQDADVALFNGCMVRQKAEEKVFGRIGAVVEEKRHRDLLLGVGGCLGQIRGSTLLKRFKAIDFLFGSRGHAAIPSVIEQVRREGVRIAAVDNGTEIDEIPFHRSSAVTAMVTITEGCSNFCSYCIVPHARGPMRSRAPERILAEVEAAVSEGYGEVMLLGQNVNSYGIDRPEFGDFVSLLQRVAATGIGRIRFTSSHPRDMTDAVLETIAAHPNICAHIHLACQSGSDRVLAAMNRGTTQEHFLGIVQAARRIVPGINITTDLIVGYPGETEEDFEETMKLLEEARFGTVYVAKYSPRPGTRSAEQPDDVPADVKNERLQRVLARQRVIALEENERYIGETVTVLVENASSEAVFGRTDDHRTVILEGPAAVGELCEVRIHAASASSLSGSVLISEGVGGAP